MSGPWLLLVGYDISCPRRLRAALKIAKGHALGGQKSLYECWMSESEFTFAMEQMSALINPVTDRVIFLRLDPRAKVETMGVAKPPNNDAVLYFG